VTLNVHTKARRGVGQTARCLPICAKSDDGVAGSQRPPYGKAQRDDPLCRRPPGDAEEDAERPLSVGGPKGGILEQAHIAEFVGQELLLRNEPLAAENRDPEGPTERDPEAFKRHQLREGG
jgi:hypothetical protein